MSSSSASASTVVSVPAWGKVERKGAKTVIEGIIDEFSTTIGLQTEISTDTGTLTFFNNSSRGKKVSKVKKADTTKDKNPFQAWEEVWQKPETGVKNKAREVLNGIKIDLQFYLTNPQELLDFIKEKLLWLKLWEDAEDKNKTERFGSKKHKEECAKYGLTCPKTTVEETEGRKEDVWDFKLVRSDRKEAFGGGKTSYKTKYEELLEWVRNEVEAERLEAFLQSSSSPASSRSSTPVSSPELPKKVPEKKPEVPKKQTIKKPEVPKKAETKFAVAETDEVKKAKKDKKKAEKAKKKADATKDATKAV